MVGRQSRPLRPESRRDHHGADDGHSRSHRGALQARRKMNPGLDAGGVRFPRRAAQFRAAFLRQISRLTPAAWLPPRMEYAPPDGMYIAVIYIEFALLRREIDPHINQIFKRAGPCCLADCESLPGAGWLPRRRLPQPVRPPRARPAAAIGAWAPELRIVILAALVLFVVAGVILTLTRSITRDKHSLQQQRDFLDQILEHAGA